MQNIPQPAPQPFPFPSPHKKPYGRCANSFATRQYCVACARRKIAYAKMRTGSPAELKAVKDSAVYPETAGFFPSTGHQQPATVKKQTHPDRGTAIDTNASPSMEERCRTRRFADSGGGAWESRQRLLASDRGLIHPRQAPAPWPRLATLYSTGGDRMQDRSERRSIQPVIMRGWRP